MKNLFKSAFILSGLASSVFSFAESGNYYKTLPIAGTVMNISDNGQYVISCSGMSINYLYNDATGKAIIMDNNDAPYCITYAVANNGMAVGQLNDLPAYYKDGEWTFLELPEGYTAGLCSGVSSDGSKIYGSINAGFFFTPVIWENGSVQFVDVLQKDLFNKIPEGGFLVDRVSNNGTYMAGRVIDYNYHWYPVLWKDGVPTYINPDLFKDSNGKPNKLEMEVNSFSPDNKFLSLNLMEVSGGTDPLKYTATIYNIEDETMTTVESELMMFVDNKGRGYSAAPQNILLRTGYVHVNDMTFSIEDWALNNYGIDMIGESGIEYSGTPTAIAQDGVTMVGYATDGLTEVNYMMRLSQPLPTGIQNQNEVKPVVYSNQSAIHISSQNEAKVSIFDLTGRMLKHFEMESGSESVEMESGTYFVKIQQGESVYSYKTIINF